jgi:beta-galactosidase
MLPVRSLVRSSPRDIQALAHLPPSDIFYSIGNEILGTGVPVGAELGRRLAEKVRSLDPTRLITNGINGFVSVLPDVVA